MTLPDSGATNFRAILSLPRSGAGYGSRKPQPSPWGRWHANTRFASAGRGFPTSRAKADFVHNSGFLPPLPLCGISPDSGATSLALCEV